MSEHALDRALFYGDGVFRTCLVIDGEVHDLDDQLRVLKRDAQALSLDLGDEVALRAQIGAAVEEIESGVLRILCCRREAGRGYAPVGSDSEILTRVSPLPDYDSRLWSQGAGLNWSSVLLGIQPRLAGIKHLNRLEQVLASRDLGEGVDEVLMCDAAGRVIGGSRSNLFFFIDNILVTPELSTAGIAGRMREKVIKIASLNGIDCETGLISPDEVRHAQEAFMSNSLIGLWPVRRIGDKSFAAPGPVTKKLQALLRHPWGGR